MRAVATVAQLTEVLAQDRRWTDFEDYLIPRDTWLAEREQHYAALGLPIDSDIYLTQLEGRLHAITAGVDARVPHNSALTIDRDKGEYHLARLQGQLSARCRQRPQRSARVADPTGRVD